MVVARVSLLIGTDSDSNKWEYELEDGTGRVTAVRWTINLSEDEKERLLENILSVVSILASRTSKHPSAQAALLCTCYWGDIRIQELQVSEHLGHSSCR